METTRTKEEVYQMLNYILEPEDVNNENLLAHWTDVLFKLHEIRQRFPRPTIALLEMNNEVFAKRIMKVDNSGLNIDSNHSEKWLEKNKADIKVFGDVTLESCEKDLTVIGNINGNVINVKGDLKPDTLCNFGNLTIYCEKLNVDDFRVSGSVTINSKENIFTDFYSDRSVVNGNIKTTFFNSNKIEVNGSVDAVSVTNTSDEDFTVNLNKP